MSAQIQLNMTMREIWKVLKDCKKCREAFLKLVEDKARQQSSKSMRETIIKSLEGSE